MPLSLPTQLGPYELLSHLGTGGMGEVYRARDSRLGRMVAVKVLSPSFAADSERLRRFEAEARAIASLNHPNILQVFDTGVSEGSPFIVMELLQGETLRKQLNSGPLPTRTALDIALQMARGLSAAHGQGIVHRDLKPENTFITRDGQVKILDFGLAKLDRDQVPSSGEHTLADTSATLATRYGTVMGTAGYMSPEQIQGIEVDARSDLFAFGTMLWEMLCGSRPFRGESTVDLLHAILRENPGPWPASQPLAPTLERLLLRCLHKDPVGRFQSAADLAYALEHLDLTQSFRWPTLRLPRRMPGASLGLLGALLALGAGYGWGSRQIHPIPRLQRRTYQHGTITHAAFTPDGESILFSMSSQGRVPEIWQGRVDGVGAQLLGLPAGTLLLAVSPRGDLALLTPQGEEETGILSRLPLTGGQPRELLSQVCKADWLPDGEQLAVVRKSPEGRMSIEFPAGNQVYTAGATETLSDLKVSPNGAWVAFASHDGLVKGFVGLVNRQGKLRHLGAIKTETLVWSPRCDELAFVAQLEGDQEEIRAVDLKGRTRRILPIPNRMHLQGGSRKGQLLLRYCYDHSDMAGRLAGQDREQDYSWLQSTTAADISHDGRMALFAEFREGARQGGVYIRRPEQPGPIRLGEGDPLCLSPDGHWAVVRALTQPPAIHFLPTGQGQPRIYNLQGLVPDWVAFRGDDRRLLIGGAHQGDSRFQVYELDCGSGRLTLRISDVSRSAYPVVSPDGRSLCLGPVEGKLQVWDLETAAVTLTTSLIGQEYPVQWAEDGRAVLLADLSRLPAQVTRLDLATGRRQTALTLSPFPIQGVKRVRYLAVTPDLKGYIYSYDRSLASDLYTLEGWK